MMTIAWPASVAVWKSVGGNASRAYPRISLDPPGPTTVTSLQMKKSGS